VDTATITAVLTDYEGMPLEGMPVTLDLDTMHDTVLTGPDGSATWTVRVNLSEGTYTVNVSFAGDELYVES